LQIVVESTLDFSLYDPLPQEQNILVSQLYHVINVNASASNWFGALHAFFNVTCLAA